MTSEPTPTKDLEPGKTYYYILRAVNAVGAGPWTRVPIGNCHSQAVPDAPVLTATAARSSIDLSWTVPDDNGTPITGYQISSSGTITANNIMADIYRQSDRGETMPLTVTEITDTGLAPGTKYFYRIRALTGDSRQTIGGAWSTEDGSTRRRSLRYHQWRCSGCNGGSAYHNPRHRHSHLNGMDTITDVGGRLIGGSDITGYSVQRWNSDTSIWDEVATPTAVTHGSLTKNVR